MGASGKRHLLLTGGRGAGKSTALNALPLPEKTPRFRTKAVPGQCVWFCKEGQEPVCIGRFSPASTGTENRMQPVAEGLLAAAKMLQSGTAGGSEFVFLDEIGYLESHHAEYTAALDALFTKKRVIAAVRAQPLPFLQKQLARPDALVLDLSAPAGRMGCVIMASGLGRRFGGSKLLVPFLGRPLLEYAIHASEGVFADRVLVTRNAEAADFARKQGVRVMLHEEPYRSDTVRLGLNALQPGLTGAVFCPADQPCLKAQTLLALGAAGQSAPEFLWRVAYGERAGAPAAFSQRYFEELLHLPMGKGGNAVLRRHEIRVKTVQAQSALELADIDTKQDLADLSALLKGL